MANDYVPDYEDYLSLKERKQEIQDYYAIAQTLKAELETSTAEHQYYKELVRKMSYNVGTDSKYWSGPDAESYANTARDICSKLREAESTYLQGLQDIMDYCDKEAERYSRLILETEEKMNAWAKAQHFWNAGVRGEMDG